MAEPTNLYPKATDEEVREWGDRHALGISSMTNLRDAFEDAQTFPPGVSRPAATPNANLLYEARSCLRPAIEREEAFRAAIGEPDCWAILTPNGSKLVPPDEAKGSLAAYPLYTAAQMRATSCTAAAPLSDDEIDKIARRHGTSLNTHDARLIYSKMRWREFARDVLAANGVRGTDGGKANG